EAAVRGGSDHELGLNLRHAAEDDQQGPEPMRVLHEFPVLSGRMLGWRSRLAKTSLPPRRNHRPVWVSLACGRRQQYGFFQDYGLGRRGMQRKKAELLWTGVCADSGSLVFLPSPRWGEG